MTSVLYVGDDHSTVALRYLCLPFYSKYISKSVLLLFHTLTDVQWFMLAKYLLVRVFTVLFKHPSASLLVDVLAAKDCCESVYLVFSKQMKTNVIITTV